MRPQIQQNNRTRNQRDKRPNSYISGICLKYKGKVRNWDENTIQDKMRPVCESCHLSYGYDFPKKKMVRQICSDYIALEMICIWRHCLQGKKTRKSQWNQLLLLKIPRSCLCFMTAVIILPLVSETTIRSQGEGFSCHNMLWKVKMLAFPF